jgi:ABC-type dipeptide/oligopeptide/nickel transport system permease subunit
VARFILRRLIGMVLVLFAVSILTFLIFNVIPNGDPAVRMAGKNSTPVQIDQIRKTWHFDEGLPQQYLFMMKQIFTGELISYTDRTNVWHQIRMGLPRTIALAVGAAILWMILGISLGLYSAVRAGKLSDRLLTVLALREKEFIEAARAQGMGSWRIMFTELLPNLASTLLVFFPIIVANAILLEAALSFLGAGVQPPNPSWGTMLSDGIDLLISAPHLTIVPGLMLVMTVLSLNVFGDGVRDALDPRAKVKIDS